MFQWNCSHREALVLVYHLVLCWVNRVHLYLELQSLAEVVELLSQQRLQVAVGIDVEWGSASQHPERRNHAYESEAVVAVEM